MCAPLTLLTCCPSLTSGTTLPTSLAPIITWQSRTGQWGKDRRKQPMAHPVIVSNYGTQGLPQVTPSNCSPASLSLEGSDTANAM